MDRETREDISRTYVCSYSYILFIGVLGSAIRTV